MAATIWLVRHGATEWSQNGRHTGSTDLPLLPEGRERAVTLAPVLAQHDFSRVLASPLQRARETAALAGFSDPHLDDDLREWDYGDYEGVTTSTIRETHADWSVWDGDMPGGEAIEQVATRAARVLARADEVGGDELIEKIANGYTAFDAAVSTPELMGKVGRLGKVLGPRNLMPNPKTGTVTPDVAKAVSDIKGGKIEFRVDKHSNVHFIVGKASFSADQLNENISTALDEIVRLKPSSSKGRYVQKGAVSTTFGPGIPLDVQSF